MAAIRSSMTNLSIWADKVVSEGNRPLFVSDVTVPT